MVRTFTLQLLVSAIFVFLFSACNEDTIEPSLYGSIKGQVITSDSVPIAGASISTNPGSSAVVSDGSGNFIIDNLGIGNYAVTVKKAGYRTETVNIAVSVNVQTSAALVLEEQGSSNTAPSIPSRPTPANESINQEVPVKLKWESTDADEGDTIRYDVYLFESGNPQRIKIASNEKADSLEVPNLKFNTTYFWQVVAKDKSGTEVSSPVWSFTTDVQPVYRYLFSRLINGNYDIFLSNGTETGKVQLTNSFAREWWPIMSPRQDEIAYSSNSGIEPQIFVMDKQGGNKRQLTILPIVGYHNQGIGFAWSPDGGRLIYAHYDKLYSIRRDGTDLTLLATAPANRHFRMLDWSIQGDKILAQTIGSNIYDSEIYILNASGAPNMTLVVGNLPGRIEYPSFSIDGKRILYTRDVSGFESADGRQLDSHIFIQNLDGTGLIDVSAFKPAGTNDIQAKFSPDYAKIIFTNTSNDGISEKSIWTVELADLRTRTKLISNAEMPDWK